jgi:hypothetical protein
MLPFFGAAASVADPAMKSTLPGFFFNQMKAFRVLFRFCRITLAEVVAELQALWKCPQSPGFRRRAFQPLAGREP